MVDVAVSEQHGDWAQAMLADEFGHRIYGVLSRIDDDAFPAGSVCKDIAIRSPGPCRESLDQHDRQA